jgi:hypothetical protein
VRESRFVLIDHCERPEALDAITHLQRPGKSLAKPRDIIGACRRVCCSRSVVKKPHDPRSVARSPIGAPSAHAAGRMGDMDWWRSRRRRGAGLGLLALLVQIALSFGHLHLQDIRPASAQFAAAATQPAQVDPEPARRHVPPGLPDDDCPLCIAVHMAASGLLSVPPAMNIPGGFIHIAPSPIAARQRPVRRYVLFRTRAPPAA